MHAAQNEKLPLRVVVQVLFFEQARAAGPLNTATRNILVADQWSMSDIRSPKSRISILKSKAARDYDLDKNDMSPDGMGRPSKFKTFCALPTGLKRMFNKLLSIN
ncbi:hypothetical protein F3Y22_tig00113725pilonHSYRG00774 [Hibiscus syriacus]|uniref:NPH3 domain-containing protein n=1 Tax=Hibiscus syriacus TaxID=106335 RepID=A0A6A2Y1D9_HIBSY|nr:hypothetical protein F3Y22_tig00113725pilonHSYRG00774 [Hibiscus syriacus]